MPPYPDIPKAFNLTGEPLFSLGSTGPNADLAGITIQWDVSYTNAHFTMLIVMAAILVVAFVATRALEMQPGPLQNAVELLVQGLADFVESIGGKPALKYLPLFGTLFIFLIFSNWLSVVPLIGQVVWLHSPTADYHTNLGLAIVGFFMYQTEGFKTHGIRYASRWVNLSGFAEKGSIVMKLFMGVVFILVGIIELFSEIFRMITLTLRLWGNVLGGEIMLVVMSALLFLPGLALPFVGLEVFIGLVQALIFALLVLIYFILAIESHEEHPSEADHRETAPEGVSAHQQAA
ncbi:MAG: F0F1 ATP synthase subunit A [Chloroflexota bacterium]|nr:F0F1 ATP synthase subunit A [Chloroflexota bacterium]